MTEWNADAQQHLDAANSLFPGRYRAVQTRDERWQIVDDVKRRSVGLDADPVVAARRASRSAVLSKTNRNNGGPNTESRAVRLHNDLWALVDARGGHYNHVIRAALEAYLK